jgi:hypothetical protein
MSAYTEWLNGMISDAEYNSICKADAYWDAYYTAHPDEYEEEFEDDEVDEY